MVIEIDEDIRGLIFDIDGTLADTMPIHYQAWVNTAIDLDFHYPEKLFYELAGIPTTKIVPILNERLNINLDVENTVRIKEQYFLEKIHLVKPIEPVVEVVQRYYGILPMALGTGGRREMAKLTIDAIGLGKFFDVLVTAEDVEHHKPAPDTFLKCAELLGIDPIDCLVFEDGEPGIESAIRAGIPVIDIRQYL